MVYGLKVFFKIVFRVVVGIFMLKTITHDLVFVEGCLMVVGWMYFYTCNEPFAAIQNEVTKGLRQVRAGIHTRVVVVGGGSNKMVFCIFTRFLVVKTFQDWSI